MGTSQASVDIGMRGMGSRVRGKGMGKGLGRSCGRVGNLEMMEATAIAGLGAFIDASPTPYQALAPPLHACFTSIHLVF
jgi:hypothetical protein